MKKVEKLKEAVAYWTKNIHANCEPGSGRDRLAISDIPTFMEVIASRDRALGLASKGNRRKR